MLLRAQFNITSNLTKGHDNTTDLENEMGYQEHVKEQLLTSTKFLIVLTKILRARKNMN